MTDLEIQEQAEKYAIDRGADKDKKAFRIITNRDLYDHTIECFEACAKWLQEQDEWIEIKSKDDLPKNENYGLYHVITKEVKYCDEPQNQGIEEYWEKDAQKDKWWLDNVIWYQPIIKPSPPKTK